ncbi:MAG: hypothetical protein WCA30_17045 [Dermatophilaceae bacterium]
MSFTTAALLVSWLTIALLALGLAGLMRQIAELRRAQQLTGTGPSRGTSLVGLALPTTGPLAGLRPQGGGVVVVTAPGCSSCHQTVETLLGCGLAPHTVAVSASTCEARGLQRCLSDAAEVIDLLGVPATPYLLAVDADGVIRATDVPAAVEDVLAFAQGAVPLVRPPHRLDLTTEEAGP